MARAVRDPEQTRSEILRAAFIEVYHKGFQATSVNEIVAKTNLTKGAFFHYFPTKNDLGYAIVDEILTELTLDRWIRPLEAYANPLQGIVSRFRKIIEETTDEDMGYGCPTNNLNQEMSSVDPVFREKIKGVLTLWIDETERYLRKAKSQGFLKPGVNIRQVAEFVVTVEEGSFAIAKSTRDRRVWWSIAEALRVYLDSIRREAPRIYE